MSFFIMSLTVILRVKPARPPAPDGAAVCGQEESRGKQPLLFVRCIPRDSEFILSEVEGSVYGGTQNDKSEY